MKTFTTPVYNRQTKNFIFLILIGLMMLSFSTKAQFRSYTKVFSDNIKGGITMFGNTLTHIVTNGEADTAKMNNNRADGNGTFGNDGSNIQFVDIDGNTGIGAGTRNSSSADLLLPEGSNTIKLARLYWGGRVKGSEFNLALDTFKRVKIKYSTDAGYTEYAAAQMDKNSTGTGNSIVNQYQAYVDITPFIQANGTGTYTVANTAASIGAVNSGGNFSGWCIVIIYENLSMPDYNSIRVYDGFQQVYNGGAVQVTSATLNGLNVPSGAISFRDAKMGAMVWEGDANLKLDYLKINGTNFYNEVNAMNNPWNGTISDTGINVTTKYPNYTNQMGIDIDQFYAGTGFGIQPGDTSVTLEFGTEADQYFPGLFTFQIKTNDPTIIIDKFVNDANGNKIAEPNEVLTYTLKGKNVGAGNANYCVITDTLPYSVMYVPGSMKVITCAGMAPETPFTDDLNDDQGDFDNIEKAVVCRIGSGADGISGGILAPGEIFEIQFQVMVNTISQNRLVPPIINIARITGYSDAGIKSTDDGTAILEPLGGPLPITLKTFFATLSNSSLVKINWATSMEINCRKYDIERSFDGKIFIAVATITGNGNTSEEHRYSISDDVIAVNSPIIYYRLKQVDNDGIKSYSRVISVKLKKTINDFTVSPNPFNSTININIDWNTNENTNVKVFSIAGKELVSKSIQMFKGTNNVVINELSSLPAGNYFILFNTVEGRILKQVTKQ